jgi:hypothetical protein
MEASMYAHHGLHLVALSRRSAEVDIAAKGISCVPRVIRVIDQRKHEALPGKDTKIPFSILQL